MLQRFDRGGRRRRDADCQLFGVTIEADEEMPGLGWNGVARLQESIELFQVFAKPPWR